MAVPAAPVATTTPTMAGLLTAIVSKQVIATLRLGRFFLPPGAIDFEAYPAPGSTDQYIRASYQDLVVDPAGLAGYVLAEGVTPTAVAFGSDNTNFSTVEYARLVTVTSEQIRTNPHNFWGIVAEKVANASQDLIDAVAETIWAGYAAAGVPVILPGAAPAATNPLDRKAVLKAATSLRTRGVATLDGTYYGGMATSAVLATLQQDTNWIEAAKYADPVRLLTGEAGTIGGVRWFANDRIIGKTATVFASFVFGKEAMTFADVSSLRVTSVPPMPSISDPLSQRGAAGFAVRCGGKFISDLSPDTTTRRFRVVAIESTADPAVVPA